MDIEPIRLREVKELDRQQVQREVVRAVQSNPEHFLQKYSNDSRSFDGRYVCADLFKETFPQYAASNESCARYNNVVHNAAAVLASAQFREVLKQESAAQRDTVVFLTGIPGAGKTSHIAPNRQLEDHVKLVYEGQLSQPQTGMVKIQEAINAGCKVDIVVVHALPEDALRNTYKRYGEVGRGASIEVMSDIQGHLPAGLQAIHEQFQDKVSLYVVDVRNRAQEPIIHSGWQQLHVIQSEGSYDNIKQRLTKQLESDYAAGRITQGCYDQACGRVPLQQNRSLAQANSTLDSQNVLRRNLPQGSRPAHHLDPKETPYMAGKGASDLSRAKAATLVPAPSKGFKR